MFYKDLPGFTTVFPLSFVLTHEERPLRHHLLAKTDVTPTNHHLCRTSEGDLWYLAPRRPNQLTGFKDSVVR